MSMNLLKSARESYLFFKKCCVKCQLVPVDLPATIKASVNCLNVDAHLCLYSPWPLVMFVHAGAQV